MGDLSELKQLEKKATPGPWSWEEEEGGRATVYSCRMDGMHGMNLFGRLEPDWNGNTNLGFLCEMRNAAPALLARLEELEEFARDIYEMCNFDDPDSYVADDRSGCLETIYAKSKEIVKNSLDVKAQR